MDEDIGFNSHRGSNERLTNLAKSIITENQPMIIIEDGNVDSQLTSVTTMIEDWTRDDCVKKLKEDPYNFEAHYKLAFLEIEENNYTVKFKVHQEAVHRIKPNYKPEVVTLTQGEIYWSEKNYLKAIDYYLKNYEVTEEKVQCTIRIGECYEKIRELDKAKIQYIQALDKSRKNSWLLYRLGKVHYLQGEHTKAAENFYSSIRYEPGNYKCIIKSGINFMATKVPNVSQALNAFDQALNLVNLPLKYEIISLNEKTKCLDAISEIDLAIDTCTILVDIDPYNLKAKEYLAQQYLKNGQNKKALTLYKQILKDNRSNYKWYQEIGTLYALNGQFDSAKKYLQQSLKIEPFNDIAAVRLGKVLLNEQNDTQGALDVYNSILKLDSSNYKILYQLGVMYLDQKDYIKAALFLKDCLKSNPKYVRGWTTMANFTLQEKKYDSSQKFFERAYNLDSSCLESKIGIGKCNYYMKKTDEALKILKELEKLHPKNYEINFYIGNCFYHKGNFQYAQEKFKKCNEIDPNKIEALFSLGNIYCEQDDFKKSAEIFEDVLKKDPNNIKAKINLHNCHLMNYR